MVKGLIAIAAGLAVCAGLGTGIGIFIGGRYKDCWTG